MAENISFRLRTVNCAMTHAAGLVAQATAMRGYNRLVPPSPWEARIERAQSLSGQLPFAVEILSFYIHVARFQQDSYRGLETGTQAHNLPGALGTSFLTFLSMIEEHGPERLAETSRALAGEGREKLESLLQKGWSGVEISPSQPDEFLVRAFLQPHAVFARTKSGAQWNGYSGSLCPFCGRKPASGVLRPRGEGGQRSLLCSFCLAEWEFRRILCAGCGETDYLKLPVYQAGDFDYIRVDCCDTCKQYLKIVDLTKNGLADPVVDEIAAAPLDLWARQQGYSKLELNLVGL